MFSCCTMEDLIFIKPENFGKDVTEQLVISIKHKYVNKIIPKIGCCMAFCDLLEFDKGFILHNDGSSYHNSKFRLIIFRPLIGEVMTGSIARSTTSGIFVEHTKFADIFIPPRCMPENMEFLEDEQVWVWNINGEKSWLDIGEKIRFKVDKEEFSGANKKSGYLIVGSINGDGLGLVTWWED
eukprot:NODE_612_length_5407_cov_0.901093.p4 type:complete len:182 gc:universal NODE_612_length_5407_cov_0.901093:209-754(+)